MTRLLVDTAAAVMHLGEHSTPCVIGRSGACRAEDKREGDGATPLGLWPLRAALLRRDRLSEVRTVLPWRWLDPADGWSDDPADPAYNRAVRHPHRYSAERLWRDDTRYDAIIVLGYNDAPPAAGRGSAIFLHCTDFSRPTEGCVAIADDEMQALLPSLALGDQIEIV